MCVGWRLDFGHYYLLARKQARSSDRLEERWVQLNDHVVQRGISAEQADLFASKGAYMIFYTKAHKHDSGSASHESESST